MHRLLVFLLFILFYTSCTKDSSNRKIVITGRFVQSSSNTVGVNNLKLSFYQFASSSVPVVLPGTTFPSSAESVTDNDGYFKTNFTRGGGILNSNHNSITMGATTILYGQSFLGNVPATDTDLGTINLFKHVHTAIVEITPEKTISPTDSIYVNAITDTGFYSKLITGISIPANTSKIIDTITNTQSIIRSILNNEYSNTVSVLLKYIYGDTAPETAADENEKTYSFSLSN